MNRRDWLARALGALPLAPALLARAAAAAPPKPQPTGRGTGGLPPVPGRESDHAAYLGTPRTEAGVRRSLKYLAHNQNADGSWGDSAASTDVAISGLCCLALMSAGHQAQRGPYGEILRKGADYLAAHCSRTGLFYDPDRTQNRIMYGHGFATLAVAELYGMTRRSDLRDKLEAAVALILRTQNEEGGWRYDPRPYDADISVVICQLMALRAAANAGLRIPPETTRKALGYVKRCSNNADGGFSYRPSERASGLGRTGAGVLALIVNGERDSEECRRGLSYLATRSPRSADNFRFYAFYYCTQALYQAGGDSWRRWYPQLADYLLSAQRPEGNWYDAPGYAYATAMGTLALQVPAALLPVYQR